MTLTSNRAGVSTEWAVVVELFRHLSKLGYLNTARTKFAFPHGGQYLASGGVDVPHLGTLYVPYPVVVFDPLRQVLPGADGPCLLG